ncbi:MAG: helix-turn-helix transcriptional regulator [Coriobacteriales bacterium]|nr:helix-turn-helix transcriptional regulator [Coriobacteriales bacterium]
MGVADKGLAHIVLPALGMAPLWPYFRAHHLSFLVASFAYDTATSQIAYTSFAIAFALFSLCVALLAPRIAYWMHRHESLVFAVCLAVIGIISELALWIPVPQEILGAVLSVGAVLSALYFMAAVLWYGSALMEMPAQKAAIAAFLSFGLCFFSNAVLLMPIVLQGIIRLLCPVLTIGCLVLLTHPSRGLSIEVPEQKPIPSLSQSLASAGIPFAFMILFALFCFTGNVARGVTNPWYVNTGLTWHTTMMTVINVVVVLISVILLVREFPVKRVIFWNWTVFVVLFFAGVFLLVFSPDEELRILGSDFITTARVCFTLLMFLFAIFSAPNMPFGLTRLLGLMLFIPESISGIARFIGVPAILREALFDSSMVTSYVSMGIIFILLIGVIVLLNNMLMKQAGAASPVQETTGDSLSLQAEKPAETPSEPNGPLPEGRTFEDALDYVAKTYALTARESETAQYFSRGYSLEKTADLLGVSINTVRSHIKNVYSKLGIHSRQELIDIIDDAKQA